MVRCLGVSLRAVWPWVLIGAMGCRDCLGCRPGPSTQHTDVDTDEPTIETDLPVETGETAVELPRCRWVDVEPDGFASPSPLAVEELGCGSFAQPFDADWWRFSIDQSGWLRVRIDAVALGSRADPMVSLVADAGDTVAQANRADGHQDVLLVFPASAGGWGAFVGEQLQSGGDAFPYEILVSSAKAPVVCSLLDEAGNDAWDRSQDLAGSDCVFGEIVDSVDTDWYTVIVPPGKHDVRLAIEAAIHGSPADLRLEVRDADGEVVALAQTGLQGYEPDPVVELVSAGDEVLYVGVINEGTGEGAAYWYLLAVGLEAT